MRFKNRISYLHNHWYLFLVAAFLMGQAILFAVLGEDIYVSMHDNLDLHIADYHILSSSGAFFSHNAQIPILSGISRDYFASELSAYSMLYFFMPTAAAYISGYFLKTVIGMGSFVYLLKYLLSGGYEKYKPIVVLTGFAYGILPFYPAFSFAFASLPLIVLLLLKIDKTPRISLYLLLFLYPLLSYFTFFGIFILGYLLLSVIFLSVKRKKITKSLLLAFVILSAGYIVCEYRLFSVMLFDAIPSIRDTMVMGSLSMKEITGAVLETFTKGIFHAESVHTWFVLPVCLIYGFILNFKYLKNKRYTAMVKDGFNLIMLFILFNCIIYGLYYHEGLRSLWEAVCPPLKGMQLTRTVFFNPLLWYLVFFMVLKGICDSGKQKLAVCMTMISIAVVLLTGSKYNDLFTTAYNYAYRIIKNQESNSLTYREFYSEELFEEIKEDIDYQKEWSVAYGMHPAVLQYSGIHTLDGCISYYPQEYKERFREIIAPALDRVESFRLYYDDWGARAYLFAGIDENVYDPVKNLQISDGNLYINADAFRNMGGTYIFSRLPVLNAGELKLTLRGEYSNEASPYTIYLYENS